MANILDVAWVLGTFNAEWDNSGWTVTTGYPNFQGPKMRSWGDRRSESGTQWSFVVGKKERPPPGHPVVKSLLVNSGIPGLGRFHMASGQLKPLCHNYWARVHWSFSATGEATTMRNLGTATRERPHSNRDPTQPKISNNETRLRLIFSELDVPFNWSKHSYIFPSHPLYLSLID